MLLGTIKKYTIIRSTTNTKKLSTKSSMILKTVHLKQKIMIITLTIVILTLLIMITILME